MIKVLTLNKKKKEKDSTKKWKGFSVSLNKFELEDVSDLSEWAHVQGSSVVQREQHKYDVKKKHQEPESCLYKYLRRVLI